MRSLHSSAAGCGGVLQANEAAAGAIHGDFLNGGGGECTFFYPGELSFEATTVYRASILI